MKKPAFNFDPGTGLSASTKQRRIMNKDGNFNIIHTNRAFSFRDIYGFLLDTTWVNFFGFIFLIYLAFNLVFGAIYFKIGVESLGISSKDFISDFLNSFYFSAQTFTTIGYGFLAPKTLFTSGISAIEGFIGLLFFAFASGLFYGRFSRPKPNLSFTNHCIVKNHNEGRALMFKLIHKDIHVAMNVNLEVVMALKTIQNEKTMYTYFPLPVERNRITMLPYSWTVVHQIDENSPLLNYTNEQLNKLDAELLVLVNYYDETFSQQVYQRHSYTFDEIQIDKTFVQNFYYNVDGFGVLDHQKLNELEEI